MQDQRRDPRSERGDGLEAPRRRGRYMLATARADAAMAIDPGDDRTDRRPVDVVPRVRPLAGPRTGSGVDVGHVRGGERVIATRTSDERGLDDLVRMLGQGAGHPGAARPGSLFGRSGQVRFRVARRRLAGVVRGFTRRGEPGFQFGHARGQRRDLPGLRLDPGMLGQDQVDQVVVGKGEEGCAGHASP